MSRKEIVLYLITNSTKVIQKVQKGNYRSKIIDETSVNYSIYHPEKIIDYNCKINGVALKGRHETVMDILETKSKLPIPVSPKFGIFLFPTTSMKNQNCMLLSYYHVKKYVKDGNYVSVQLKDRSKLLVKTSFNQFDLQMKRTSQVIAYFYWLEHFAQETFIPV